MKSNRPARPYWTGFLKLSLVTAGVRLYTATTEADKVRFNMIHEPSGQRVRQQLHVPDVGPVERHDIVKGYEYAKDTYITVTEGDLKALKLESTDVIDVAEVVEADAIDPVYFDQPYYLLPEGGASEQSYRVIYEALKLSGKVAIGQVVISMNERVLAIRATADGLIAHTLRYPDELRDTEAYYGTVPVSVADPDEVAIMAKLIERKTVAFEPGRYVDHYQSAVKELIEAKLAGTPPVVHVANPPKVGNLMDALKASLAAEDAAVKSFPKPPKAAKKAKPHVAKTKEAKRLVKVLEGRATAWTKKKAPVG